MTHQSSPTLQLSPQPYIFSLFLHIYAASLGFAAGVMLFVSFPEIMMRDALYKYQASGFSQTISYRYTILTFFAGMALAALIDQVLHIITDRIESNQSHHHHISASNQSEDIEIVPLSRLHNGNSSNNCSGESNGNTHLHHPNGDWWEVMKNDPHSFALKRMGLMTAVVIFIHNFPEGIATFVGTLNDPKLGLGVALAVGLHNLPEGICVAMPLYYATGDKWKAFLWAVVPALSEPVGGLFAYLVMPAGEDQGVAFAVVMGMVAGVMVYIAVDELIPTALKYDPENKVAIKSVVAGMVFMGLSLVLFTL